MAIVDVSNIQGIDEIDKGILGILQQDARASYTDIAKEVNLTRPAVKNRIKSMEDKGIIKEYKTIINPMSDENGLKFILNVTVDPAHYLEVADKIALFKVHRQVYSRTGYSHIVKTLYDLYDKINCKEDLKKIRCCGDGSAQEIMEQIFMYQYNSLNPERREKFIKRVVELNSEVED